ncbi:hypothetical protein FSP39_023026 [Pinctada imbricata]|uniref:B box-type domain-containing protein n=1 Tax=Pinctada imbricata TaxID=66713 RepID=A0AA88XEF8_PINIB|nr:hypothetical protein FSP39_023026 [Pinctada imbricata]
MAMEKEVDLAHAQRPVPCDACEEDEVPGTYYCIQCKKTLCEDCEKSHKKFIKDHKVILRTQIGEIDASILTCADHKCEASFHCEKCNVPVCPECVIGNHQGHKMDSIKNFIRRKTEMLQGDINEMKNDVLPKLEKQEDDIKSHRAKYNSKIQEIAKEMERENHILHNELDRINQERLQSLYNTQKKHMGIFDDCEAEVNSKIDLCKTRVSEYQHAVGGHCLPDIIKKAESRDSMIPVYSVPELPEAPCFVPQNIQSFIRNLERLQISPSLISVQETNPIILSKFKSPLKGNPRIFVSKGGNAWLGGNESKKLAMVSIEGEVLMERNIQLAPYALAEMDNGDLIVSPEKYKIVKSMCIKGETRNVFDTSPYDSLGVSITTKHEILICVFDGRVLRSKPDGTNVEQIYKGPGNGSAYHSVENIDGTIFISDHANSAVIMVSKDGEVLSKITHTSAGQKLSRPNHLTVDRMGNIIFTDMDSPYIYIIDRNQKVKELLGTSTNKKNPVRLAVDDQNNLWATHNDGSITVVKYLA